MNPYSKEDQLHKMKVPSRKQRAEFSSSQRKETKRIYGEECVICMDPSVQIHHRKYRSQLGRNNPRNGAPLCNGCHDIVHENAEVAEDLRLQALDRFGPYYYFDKYDCYLHGLIDAPTKQAFEDFMEQEEREAYENLRTGNGGAERLGTENGSGENIPE